MYLYIHVSMYLYIYVSVSIYLYIYTSVCTYQYLYQLRGLGLDLLYRIRGYRQQLAW